MSDVVLEVAGELVSDGCDWLVPLELAFGPEWVELI